MPLNMIGRWRRSFAIACLTRRHYRPGQVGEGCNYFINGRSFPIYGPNALSLVIENYWDDTYGLSRFRRLKTIVDIGANIGVFSLHACTRFPSGNVIAYEPSKTAVAYLRRNTAATKIEIHEEAVGDLGPAVFLHTGTDLTAATVGSDPAASGKDTQPCRMVTFANVADRISGPISFLKLDCEGAEYGILHSSALDRVQIIAAEFHTVAAGTPKYGIELLRERGFEIESWRGCPEYSGGIVWARNRRNVH